MGGHTRIAWGTYPWSILRPLPTWSCHTGTRAIFTFMVCLKIERVVYNVYYFRKCILPISFYHSQIDEMIIQFSGKVLILHVHFQSTFVHEGPDAKCTLLDGPLDSFGTCRIVIVALSLPTLHHKWILLHQGQTSVIFSLFLGANLCAILYKRQKMQIKTLPVAKRTQKSTPWLGLNSATTWHHLH